MRRIALIVAVAALVATLGVATAGSSTASPASPARAVAPSASARAPHVRPDGGTACYVGLSECSQIPCVEFVSERASTVTVTVPRLAVPVPGVRCGGGRPGARPGLSPPPAGTVVTAPPTRGASPLTAIAGRLAPLRHELAARTRRQSRPGKP